MYNARSDVNGITSGHTPHARAFSVKGETLKMLWQDSCTFYNCVPVCPFQTAANAATNPQGIADVLGEKGIGMILQNRGVLSCAGTIEGAVGGYVRIEGLVGNQLLVEAAIKGRGGDVVPIGEEEILVGVHIDRGSPFSFPRRTLVESTRSGSRHNRTLPVWWSVTARRWKSRDVDRCNIVGFPTVAQ